MRRGNRKVAVRRRVEREGKWVAGEGDEGKGVGCRGEMKER